MTFFKSSHATWVGLALLAAACGDDDAGGVDDTTNDSSSTSGATLTSGSDGTSGSSGADGSSSESGQVSSSTGGEPALSPRRSTYLEMGDGTRIAVDVWLPTEALEGAPVPTVMQMTRYWRAMEFTLPMLDPAPEEAARYTDHGFAFVTVDARGSGASFGNRQGPWSEPEREDHGQVVDWIAGQSWSNGNVGAVGISYDGNTAAFLASTGRDAVKAVVPRFYDADAFDSPAFPGGVFNAGFVGAWSQLNAALDAAEVCALAPEEDCATVRKVLLGPKWADEDTDGSLAAQAIAEHAANLDVFEAGLATVHRDDPFGDDTTLDEVSLRHQFDAFEDGGAAMYSWASWMDAGTADSALDVFAGVSGSHRVTIGAWNHGADEDADPYLAPDTPVAPSEADQHEDILAFFAEHLADDAAPTVTREIRYATMNEGVWRTTDVWPPADVSETTLYLGEAGLVDAPAVDAGQDVHAVDYTATTGDTNRWTTQLEGDVIYPDRAAEDGKLLTYTGAPLTEDTRITGHPVVTVHLSTTRDDGALFVYLEDVAPDGSVTYLTEGQLRFLHRAPDPDASALHSFAAADALPVVPNEVMELAVRLRPTSVRIEAGHRVRVALAGTDASVFGRLPADGEATWTVRHGGSFPSRVVLPIAAK